MQLDLSIPRQRLFTGRQMLVVEPNLLLRGRLTAALTLAGHLVWEAEDGLQALRLAYRLRSRGGVDIVIAEMEVPMVPCPAMVERLQELYPAVRVVLTSGQPRRHLCVHHAFLPKPFTSTEMLQTVDCLIESRRNRATVGNQPVVDKQGPVLPGLVVVLPSLTVSTADTCGTGRNSA